MDNLTIQADGHVWVWHYDDVMLAWPIGWPEDAASAIAGWRQQILTMKPAHRQETRVRLFKPIQGLVFSDPRRFAKWRQRWMYALHFQECPNCPWQPETEDSWQLRQADDEIRGTIFPTGPPKRLPRPCF